MKTTMACLALLLAVCTPPAQAQIGDRLVRTYTEYTAFPTTTAEATAAGWIPVNTTCTYGLGYPYRLPTEKEETTILYFDATGKVSGISADVFGSPPPETTISQGYFVQIAHKRYRISLAYRSPAAACDADAATSDIVGDRVVINPAGINQSLPLTEAAAIAAGWHKGSCFYGMGHHYFYDLASGDGTMTWNAETLLPVVTMFNNDGDIQSTFFASWTVQQSLFHSVDWEPVPLPNFLMCKNLCDDDCTFKGTWLWSTYHVYYRDLALATCADDCTTACCA